MIRTWLISFAVGAVLWPHTLAAQSSQAPNEGAQVGDRWVFDRTDETTGFPKDTYTRIVTAISEKEIATDFYVRGNSAKTIMIFDRDWDLIDNSTVSSNPTMGKAFGSRLQSGSGALNTMRGTATPARACTDR